MKNHLIKTTISIIFFSINAYAQNYPNVQVKEFYDANLHNVMSDGHMESLNINTLKNN
jgi:hypothetical protein